MYIGVFDIEQYDCPIVKLTEKREGLTTTVLSVNISELPRGVEQVFLTIKSEDDTKLHHALETFSKLPEIKSYKVLGKSRDMWRVHMYISKTHTMETSVTFGTMFVSPWIARNGVERWTLGFISKKQFYDFLSRIKERDHVRRYYLNEINEEDFVTVSANYLPILNMISELNRLTPRQLSLLKLALSKGYYSWPKAIDSVQLSSLLGVSRVSIIKSLRRAEYKVLSSVLDFMTSVKKDWEKNYS
ncbi:MAG: helix-turn-helix domain-containing protein [Infirmifilum sp.]|jgi:predicted DNA binding protein|uniref:helix-turn-helix domain-containing protein n=1 Tax=Infirmifilum TaxID=2856573 RepID=UPI0023567FB0